MPSPIDLKYSLNGLAYDLELRRDSMSEKEFIEFGMNRLNRLKVQYEQFLKFTTKKYRREH